MTASILDGKTPSTLIREEIKNIISSKYKPNPPGLAVILIGNDSASKIYVNNKRKACLEVGINSFAYDLPIETSEKELLDLINQLNNLKTIHGILVQLPLPKHIDRQKIIEAISIYKDVDGFHPYNLGRLAQGNALLKPCTAFGIIELLKYYKIDIESKHALVIGASNIVGRPLALEFLNAKATVTVCHQATIDLNKHIIEANIIVVATGKKNIFDTKLLNKTQIIIDVGIHRSKDGKISGDVDFESAKENVAWITPVPGGVGPMTICALLQNTLQAFELQQKLNI